LGGEEPFEMAVALENARDRDDWWPMLLDSEEKIENATEALN